MYPPTNQHGAGTVSVSLWKLYIYSCVMFHCHLALSDGNSMVSRWVPVAYLLATCWFFETTNSGKLKTQLRKVSHQWTIQCGEASNQIGSNWGGFEAICITPNKDLNRFQWCLWEVKIQSNPSPIPLFVGWILNGSWISERRQPWYFLVRHTGILSNCSCFFLSLVKK